LDITTRGFTGHEHIDHADIIHMNGRIYDPSLGRMLQADPFIQAPKNSQSYNRYSYVLNNPLSYIDPSGYFFSKLWKGIKKFASVIVGAALIYFTGGTASWFVSSWYGAATAGAISGAVGAAANGGNILKGALTGAFSAAAFYGVGQIFEPGTFGNIVGNGLVGGVMSDLQGGNFGHGFFAAGFSAAAKPMIYEKFGYAPENAGARVVTAAVIGGTASVISGGKFANGATTGAFSQMFNGENYAKDSHKLLMRLKDRLSDEEWQYLMDNKLAAPGIAAATLQAYNKAAELYPNSLHSGEGDAFRHAYWNALITRYASAEHAEAFTSLHEKVGGGPAIENTMDMHNNAMGRSLALEQRWTTVGWVPKYTVGDGPQSLEVGVRYSLNTGGLKYIRNGKLVTN
jgi:RHS repeat-associated protein